MTVTRRTTMKALLATALMACAFVQPAMAARVNGVELPDTEKVGGKELKINGIGMRTRIIVKVYAAALYLPEKSKAVADILAMPGPRRMTLVMMRDVSSEDFGQAFMTGLNNNSASAEKTKILNQTMKFGEMFALLPALKKGDVLHLDWVPGTGTQCQLNGKPIGENLPDQQFYNAILRIWLGDKPVDTSLKPKLLGE